MHRISFSPPLSLAMYKELAAHLSQVNSVITELHWQDARDFDYDASQIGAITIKYTQESDQEAEKKLVQKILNYYGLWQEVETPNPNLILQLSETNIKT